MAETTRDITIRVNVVNGSVDLGPLDISGILASTKSASAAIQDVRQQASSAVQEFASLSSAASVSVQPPRAATSGYQPSGIGDVGSRPTTNNPDYHRPLSHVDKRIADLNRQKAELTEKELTTSGAMRDESGRPLSDISAEIDTQLVEAHKGRRSILDKLGSSADLHSRNAGIEDDDKTAAIPDRPETGAASAPIDTSSIASAVATLAEQITHASDLLANLSTAMEEQHGIRRPENRSSETRGDISDNPQSRSEVVEDDDRSPVSPSLRETPASVTTNESAIAHGRKGYAASVDNRAEEAANQVIESLRKAGHLLDMSDDEVQIIHSSIAKRAKSRIKESDREGAPSQRDQEKQDREEAHAVNNLTPEEKAMTKAAGKIQRDRMAAEQRERDARMEAATESQKQRDAAHKADEAERRKQRADKEKERKGVFENDVTNAVAGTKRGKAGQQKAIEESAAATSKASSANEAYSRSAKSAGGSALEFAKGLALVAASGETSNDELIRGIVQIQGYFHLIQGGMSTLEKFNEVLKSQAAAKEAAAAANMAQGGVNVAGVAGAAAGGEAAAVPGLISSIVSLPAVLLTAAAALAALLRQTNVWAIEADKHAKELASDFASLITAGQAAAGGRHLGQQMRVVQNIQNFREMEQPVVNIQRRGELEEKIQQRQAGMGATDFAGKQELRREMETQNALQEKKDAAENELEFAMKRAEELEKAKVAVPAERESLKRSQAAEMKTLNEGFREKPVDASPDMIVKGMIGANPLTAAADWMGLIPDSLKKNATGVVAGAMEGMGPMPQAIAARMQGTETNADVDIHNAEQRLKIKEAEAAHAEQLNQLSQQELSIDQQRVAAGKQIVAAQAAGITATREQVAEARKNLEVAKQTIAAGKQSVGMLDPGTRWQLKQLNAKLAAGGKIESQHELEISGHAPEGTTMAEARRQFSEKQGDDAGFDFAPIRLKEKEDQDRKMREAQIKEEPDKKADMIAQAENNREMGQAVEAMVEIVNLQEEWAGKLKISLEQWAKTLKEDIRRFNAWLK